MVHFSGVFPKAFFLKLAQKALKIDPMPKLLLQLHMHFSCSSTCFEGRIWEYWCCICTFAVQFVPQNSWDDTLLRPCCYLAGREEDATRWNQSLIDHARTHILDIPWSLELSKKTREKGYNNISKPSSFKLEHPRICIYNSYILYISLLCLDTSFATHLQGIWVTSVEHIPIELLNFGLFMGCKNATCLWGVWK